MLQYVIAYLLDNVIAVDYTRAKNHLTNITNIFQSMEPLWQTVNVKKLFGKYFSQYFFLNKSKKVSFHYMMPIITNYHAELKFNSETASSFKQIMLLSINSLMFLYCRLQQMTLYTTRLCLGNARR